MLVGDGVMLAAAVAEGVGIAVADRVNVAVARGLGVDVKDVGD